MVELAALTDPAAVPDAIATTLGITPQAGTPGDPDARRRAVGPARCSSCWTTASTSSTRSPRPSRELLARDDDRARARHVPRSHRRPRRAAAAACCRSRSTAAWPRRPSRCSSSGRARSSPASTSPTPDTAAAVVEICRSLDGLPLGIELAAARTISMSPIDIRDRLGDRFRILTSSPRAPRRQQTLRDVVAWSYELLDDDERALLRHAAVFAGRLRPRRDHRGRRGPTTSSAVLDLIDSLVRKSLVTADNASGTARYVAARDDPAVRRGRARRDRLDRRRPRPARRALRRRGRRALGAVERPGVA